MQSLSVTPQQCHLVDDAPWRWRPSPQIQQQIGEVNEIFRDLAVLVHDQGQQLYDVEAAVTDAADGAKQAEGQLIRASRHHRKTCTTLLLLLAVVAGALAVLYLILA